jgi:very-short-patch-repair endonuclease
MKIINCEKCGKDFKRSNYYNHFCLKNRSEFYILEEWKDVNDMYKCPECDMKFSKMGLISHYYRKHDERGITFLQNRRKNSKKHNKVKLSKDEVSRRISDGMKRCYSENRHPGWRHINSDTNRRSYPEKFFLKVFENENLNTTYTIKEKFTYGKYNIDFLIIELKLIVEIDGSQHFRTDSAIEHDKIRDDYFLNEGFKVYRIKWKDVCNNPKSEIEELIKFISNIDNVTLRKYSIEEITINKFCECGVIIKTKKSKICNRCRILNNRVVKERPSYETLITDIKNLGYVGTGRKYKVSDNSIRKWVKRYEIEIGNHNEI